MLQNLRENLKGTVAFIAIAVIVAVMVLTGVDIGSVGGTNVANVNGEDISRMELARAIAMQKSRMQSQFNLDPSDERLSDENLREPALQSLVQQKAIIQAARSAGMAVDDEVVKKQIVEGFSPEGTFERGYMENYMNRFGFTPSTLAESEENNHIMRQLARGVMDSAFLTEKDLALFASIVGQKRSFFSLTLAKDEIEKNTEITTAQIQEYYKANEESFREEEKLSLEYVEISSAYFAEKMTLLDQQIRDEYEKEIADYETGLEYEVAHILIEEKDSKDKTNEMIATVKSKLDAGEDFAILAKEYSDDLGSKNVGGSLGKLGSGVFPSEFELAAKSLEEGQVSGAIATDSGHHFIKLTSKKELLPPTFEERKDAIASVLKSSLGSEKYIAQLDELDKLTFGEPDLSSAADNLGLTVKTTELFGRGGGTGIASNKGVYTEAFSKEVFEDKQNSKMIELDSERSVVFRLKDYQESFVKPLNEVSESISKQLKDTAIKDALLAKANAMMDKIKTGESASSFEEEGKVVFKEFNALERTTVDADRLVVNQVFSMPRPGNGINPVLDTVSLSNGDITVVGLTEVAQGDKDAMENAQLTAMSGQLKQQLGTDEYAAFEKFITGSAKYKLK